MAVVDELVTILGVKLAADAVQKLDLFKSKIGGITSSARALGATAIASAASIGYLVTRASTQANELENLSVKTGLSTTRLQEWSYAAEAAGVSANTVQNDIMNLQRKWWMLGQNADNQMGRLADVFQKMSGERAIRYGNIYGISPDTVLLLRKGREGLEQLRLEAHRLGAIIPEDAIKRGAQFRRTLNELQFVVRNFTTQVALNMIPAFQKAADLFREWVALNKEWIAQSLGSVMEGILQGFERFKDILKALLPDMDKFEKKMEEWFPGLTKTTVVADLVTGALVLLGASLITVGANFILAALAAALCAAAIADVFRYINGESSALGDFLKTFPEVKALFDETAEAFRNFFGDFAERYPALMDMFGSIGGLLKDMLITQFRVLVRILREAGAAFAWVAEKVASLLNKVAEFAGFGPNAERKHLTFDEEDRITQFGNVAGGIDSLRSLYRLRGEQAAHGGFLVSPIGAPSAMREGAKGLTYNDNKNVTINLDPANKSEVRIAEEMSRILEGHGLGNPLIGNLSGMAAIPASP